MEALLYSQIFRTSTPAPPKKVPGEKSCRVAGSAELVTTKEILEGSKDKQRKAKKTQKRVPKQGKKVNSYSYNVASR